MNVLTDRFPTKAKIGDKVYELNTDYRTCLRIIMAYEDPELSVFEKHMVMLSNLYPVVPDDIEAAVRAGVKFLNCGKEVDRDEVDAMRLYSYSKDAGLIFAGFRQTHGIDLESADLHWYKFVSLFMDLGETSFTRLVGLRKRLKTGKADKWDRALAAELGDLIHLDEFEPRTAEELEAERIFEEKVERSRILHGEKA